MKLKPIYIIVQVYNPYLAEPTQKLYYIGTDTDIHWSPKIELAQEFDFKHDAIKELSTEIEDVEGYHQTGIHFVIEEQLVTEYNY